MAEARERLPAAEASLRAELDKALRAAGLKPLTPAWRPTWHDSAINFRERLTVASTEPYLLEQDPHDPERSAPWTERDDLIDEIMEEARELEQRGQRDIASRFYRVATGEGEVIGRAKDAWLSAELARGTSPNTVAGHRAALGLFDEFLKAKGPAGSLGIAGMLLTDVDRRMAAEFLAWRLKRPSSRGGAISTTTVKREASAFLGLWNWGLDKGLAEVNPWTRQTRDLTARRGRRRDDAEDSTKRPYNTAELVALLRAKGSDWAPNGGGYGPALWDAVRLGLLTGLRISEMADLRIGDVEEDGTVVRVHEGKTDNAARIVPLCDAARQVVAARLAALPDQNPAAPLWPELPVSRADGRRGTLLSTRFGPARRRILAPVTPPAALATVDFHSLRRAFAVALRDAMNARHGVITPATIAVLMGHTRGTLALDGYAPGAHLRDLRRAIDAMWKHGLAQEVREVFAATAGERPAMVRTAPAKRRSLRGGQGNA
jgi:integrase